MIISNLEIIETTEKDLDNIVALWNNGEVMHYVGYPNGLGTDRESLVSKWLPSINKDHKRKHYSIYHQEIGYCGESYYEVDDNNRAALDIKLIPLARGRGIAFKGLKFAITNAFIIGEANIVYVDPHKENKKALKLYNQLGFKLKEHPNPEYRVTHYYLELSKLEF